MSELKDIRFDISDWIIDQDQDPTGLYFPNDGQVPMEEWSPNREVLKGHEICTVGDVN